MAVHRQYINCIKQLSNGNIIMTCSSDSTIKIISLLNYHIIPTLKHDDDTVVDEIVERNKNQIISFAHGYNEGYIYIWEKKENKIYKCIHKFIPYDYSIYMILKFNSSKKACLAYTFFYPSLLPPCL